MTVELCTCMGIHVHKPYLTETHERLLYVQESEFWDFFPKK